MADATHPPAELGDRWNGDVVLKRDVFSTIVRGRYVTAEGETPAILRRLDQIPWWTAPLARHLFARERRALALVGHLGISPRLLYAGDVALVRSFIDGVALHVAKPTGDVEFFRAARRALRALHRARVTHNDLNKSQNWLRGADGRPYLTDFQLAFIFSRRSKLFRIAAYEDIRHLLKHKRKYVPEALTAKEKRILARKSVPTRIWMATGKRIYYALTRGVFGFVDREGGGPRLVYDAPKIVAALKASPQVRDAAVVSYPDARADVGLYVFVETATMSRNEAIDLIASQKVRAPEHVQLVDALPRDTAGDVRTDVLQLIAMNQLDLLTPLIAGPGEFAVIARIVAGRQNLGDRINV
jgi:predicted Ser/Thr protein kinase